MDRERRIISPDATVIRTLRERPTILVKRGPLRDRILDFGEDVAVQLRSFEFWTSFTAGNVASRIYGRVAP